MSIPDWTKHERTLVLLSGCLLGLPLFYFFASAGQLELALAAHVPFYLVHLHWKGKFSSYLLSCLFAWSGIALFVGLKALGAHDAVAMVAGFYLASVGQGFNSAEYSIQGRRGGEDQLDRPAGSE